MACNGTYTCGKCAEFLGLSNLIKEAQQKCKHEKTEQNGKIIQCLICNTYLEGIEND